MARCRPVERSEAGAEGRVCADWRRVVIGIPATILAGYAMTTQLFGVKPYAPGILLVTTLVLSLAALVATVLPARKAAALEPIRALRTE